MTTSPEKIRRAIRYAANGKKDISAVANVNFYLGRDEAITQADLDAHHLAAREIPPLVREPAEVEKCSGQANVPDGFDDFGAPIERVEQDAVAAGEAEAVAFNAHRERQRTPLVAPEVEQPGPPTLLTIADARRHVVESQIRLRSAVDRQAQCRQQVGRAISKWQAACGNVVTDTDLRRQHLKHEAEQRELRAAGVIPPRGSSRVLQSRVDQIAAATSGAAYGKGASTFSYKRPLAGVPIGQPGSTPAMSLAQSEAALRRMTAMRKLPSER